MERTLGHAPVTQTPREFWLDGWCPCCGAQIWGHPGFPAVTIAEGVRLCGWCHRRGHHQGAVRDGLLRALVTGGGASS
jgi:hypothetical protein